MPTRHEVIPQIPAEYSDGGRTMSQHARFSTIYLGGDDPIGGVVMAGEREVNESRLESMGGNDALEVIVGKRQFTYQCRRRCYRGESIREKVQKKYPTASDIDFRDLPFTLREHYLQTSATGETTFQDSATTFIDVTIVDYERKYDNPNDVYYETFSAIGQHRSFSDKGRVKHTTNPKHHTARPKKTSGVPAAGGAAGGAGGGIGLSQ